MIDRTSSIFNNKIDNKTIKQAEKSKNKFKKKFGPDKEENFKIGFEGIPSLNHLNVSNVVFAKENASWPENPFIVGNIRMGFGHYRISIAMASCAKALGFNPVWLDLASFDQVGSKMIRYQNGLYSTGSKISQKSKLFNKLVWDPMNSEGFKKLTYNAKDQKNSELLVPIFENIPSDIPYIATHAWPSQAAIHAGHTHVVNAIPDNWPMALHLSEGAIHTTQTSFAYNGYKMLDGFDKKRLLNSMSDKDIVKVGNYVDHELLVNLEEDNRLRKERIESARPLRILMTVGGAGAGFNLFLDMVKHLMPYTKAGKVTLIINFGDHKHVYDKMLKAIHGIETEDFFNEYDKYLEFVKELRENDKKGIYCICNDNIFEAVYSTNVIMPNVDVLITKPSELAFYPIPKVFMRHIGGHEVYNAIYSSQAGDGTKECPTTKEMNMMLDKILTDKDILLNMIDRINELKKEGFYNGAYECVKIASRGTIKE